MGIVVLIACILFLFFSIDRKKKKMLSPSTLFFLLWTFILFLSNLNLYNIYKPSFEAYFLILLMLLCFFIGSNMSKLFVKKEIGQTSGIEKSIDDNQIKIRYTIIYILITLLIIFTLIDCFIVIINYKQGVPMYVIRRWRLGAYGVDVNPILSRRSFIEEVIRNVVLNPFELLLPPLSAYLFFNPKKSKHKYIIFILSIIVLLLSSIAGGGGRLGFIYYFGCFLLSFLLFSSKYKKGEFNPQKYKKYIVLFMIVGLIITFLYTQIRTSSSFLRQVYTYFALPPTLLSIWLPKLQNVSHTYGMLTFFGIHSYFFRAVQTLGMNFLVPQSYNMAFQYLLDAEKFYQTGYGVGNAFVTPIYYFFIDGGHIFVCLASLFFGFITDKIYKKIICNINIKNYMYYALLMYGVFLTFIRIQTVIPSYIIAFIMIFFLFKKVKKYD